MRRAVPAVIPALLLLLVASTVPVRGGGTLLEDGFEDGLDAWAVTEPAGATVATVAGAASEGLLGLRVASDSGIVAGVSHRVPEPLGDLRVAFDVRRNSDDAARLTRLRGPSGTVLVASVTATGRLRVAGPTWSVKTDVRIRLRRWVRLALAVDVAERHVRVIVNGELRQTIRRRTGTVTSVHLAGGPGPRILSFDRFVLRGSSVQDPPDPGPDPEPTPSTSPTPSPSPSPAPEFRFEGRGSDHGVGMSQLGAVGRARAGQGHERILGHYFRGTELETRKIEGRTVRVLVIDRKPATADAPFLVCGRRGRWTLGGLEESFPRGACARFIDAPDGASVEVVDTDGRKLYEGPGEDRMVRPVADDTLLETPSRGSHSLFRGSLRVLLWSGRARVVNHVRLGDYLRGVVPREMSPSRPAAALRAQAIASRSYAMAHLQPADAVFDLRDDTRHQVYDGFDVESEATDAAIAATAGVVVTYEGRIANTLYHAAGGGATEDARNVFTPADGSLGTDVPYLRGSLDVDEQGRAYDAGSAYDAWHTGSFTLARLSRIMAKDERTDVGSIKRLVLSDRGVSGRLISVTLVAEDGSRRKVAGWLFKSVFSENRPSGGPLLSTLFYLAKVP
jgi:SpoIID/LytB domain protein